MAAEAEAAREARAKVIAAKGEQKASGALRAAAETMEQAPAALQLRFLQVSRTDRANLISPHIMKCLILSLPWLSLLFHSITSNC